MALHEYLVGLAFLTGTWGVVGLSALIVSRRRLSHLGGACAVLAFGILTCAGIVAVHLAPGALGLLSRSGALAAALLLLGVTVLACPPKARSTDPAWGPRRSSPPVTWVAAAVGATALIAWTAAAAWIDAALASTDVDTLTFHTPNVAKWIQSGSVWRVDQFSPLLANGNYPQNGDVVFLSVILPWDSDAFTRVVGIPFLALAGVAVYALALELGAARAPAALLALVFTTLPAAIFATHEGAKTDSIMLATFGAGLVFLARHFRTGRRSELALAGAGLGLAFGTKWYGVSSVVAVLALWVAVWLVAGRSRRALATNLALLAGAVALTGGFWLLRNLVVSGNPLLPTRVGLGELTLFDAAPDFIRECGGSTLASYAGQPQIWWDFVLPAFRDSYGLGGAALAVGVAGAVGLVARKLAGGGFDRRFDGRLAAFATLAVLLACVYAVTPYSAFGARGAPTLVGANTRWLLPALLAAAAVTAAAAPRLARRAGPVVALAGLLAVADGVRRGFAIPRSDVAWAGAVLVLVSLAGAGIAALWSLRRTAPRVAAALLAVILVTGSVAAGHQRQREFFDARYTREDPAISYFSARGGEGLRVGLAGIFSVEGLSPVLPAFGPRLGNDVSYIGREVKGQLREYDSFEGFAAELRGERFDLLVLGKGDYPGCDVPGTERREATWARAAGFRQVTDSDRMTLLRRER